jgi:predicted RNA-binding protein with TRAM domain
MMGVRWFCPPVGVQRFEVLVAVAPGNPPANLGDPLGADTASHPNFISLDGSATNVQDFAVYPTPGPGLDFGPGPEFDLQVPITLGVKYTVQIRAISTAGAEGPGSHFESFRWAPPPTATGPSVPWPQRPLPGPGNTPPLVFAQEITNGMYAGVVVNIGRVLRTQYSCCSTNKLIPYLQPNVKATDIVTTNMDGKSLLPFAVYRFQKQNVFFPNVSGDIIQVSPLMENLALVPGTDPQTGPYQALADPFVLAPEIFQPGVLPEGAGPLWLLDTQPVVRGATYEYLVVRFGDDGEPIEIISTPPLNVLP